MSQLSNISTPINKRINSIDLVRGVVMIFMALDHTRDFFHYGASIDQAPLDFETTSPILFLTRWITHFCAPVFVFLSGTSIFLYGNKGKTKNQIARFLFTRGLWLMFVEIFIILPLWNFNFSMLYLQVIWAIGLSMVVLSLLQYLPYKPLLILGLVIVFGHNILDKVTVDAPFWKSLFWSVLHKQLEYQISKDFMVVVQYPFLPWLGLMILGYSMGKLYTPIIQKVYRKRFLLLTGLASIVLFIVLRWTNIYGDLHKWSTQESKLYTIFDFIKTSKYPPSLLFILMTIGPALIFLAYAEDISNILKNKIIVFGRVPFFYYVIHVFLIHSLAWLLFFSGGHQWIDLDFNHFREGSLPYGSGHPLWVVYVVWVAVVIILYFPCRWYAKYKGTNKNWWLSYL